MLNRINRIVASFGVVLVSILIFGFSAWSATVVSITPAVATPGQSMTVQIMGSGFTGVKAIDFGPDVTVKSFFVMGNNLIISSINIGNNAEIGPRIVKIITDDGAATKAKGIANLFSIVTGVAVNDLSAHSGRPGQTMTLAILGSAFTGTKSVGFGPGIKVLSFNVLNTRVIVSRIRISALADLGIRHVTVTAPIGTATGASMFMVSWQASIQPACNVSMTSSPESVEFQYFGQLRTVDVTVTNPGPSGALIVNMATPAGARFNVESILPSDLPLALPPRTQQTFRLGLRSNASGVATAPFVRLSFVCSNTSLGSEMNPVLPSMSRRDSDKLTLWTDSGQIYAKTQDESIQSLQVRVFDTNGQLLIDWIGESAGRHWALPALQSDGKQIARGVYLAVIIARDKAGNTQHSEVKKLLISTRRV